MHSSGTIPYNKNEPTSHRESKGTMMACFEIEHHLKSFDTFDITQRNIGLFM